MVDTLPTDGLEMEGPPKQQKVLNWAEYFYPMMVSKLMHKKFGMFGFIVGFYYVINFCCCVAACNFYSDQSRLTPCNLES